MSVWLQEWGHIEAFVLRLVSKSVSFLWPHSTVLWKPTCRGWCKACEEPIGTSSGAEPPCAAETVLLAVSKPTVTTELSCRCNYVCLVAHWCAPQALRYLLFLTDEESPSSLLSSIFHSCLGPGMPGSWLLVRLVASLCRCLGSLCLSMSFHLHDWLSQCSPPSSGCPVKLLIECLVSPLRRSWVGTSLCSAIWSPSQFS